jgi:uncharacterized membrane protein HdeD (DUF308 family)
MGYGRRRSWKRHDGRKGRARPKLAIIGAISLATGILLINFVADVRSSDPASWIGVITLIAGVFMLLFSMSKRNQLRFARGIDTVKEMFKAPCQCCKCQNCGRNHNHWTHD